jgi:hypothetical protein
MPHEDAESLIRELSRNAGDAMDTLAGALAALCPAGKDHEYVQHRDGRKWCPVCRYTEWGVKV